PPSSLFPYTTLFRSLDLKLHQRRVVVKVLLDELLRDERIVQKFDHEREALARVNHPGVIHIIDAGRLADKKPYIVMQYVEGVSRSEEHTSELQSRGH